MQSKIKLNLNQKPIHTLGFISFLVNISTIIIVSVSPLYLTTVVGLSVAQLGMYEGLSEFVAWTSRIISGTLCDYIKNRKKVMFFSSALIALSRPLWIFSSSAGWIFFIRGLDRLGNGLGATPRDTMVGEFSKDSKRTSAFGLRQSLGLLGSFIGSIIVFFFLGEKITDYKPIFIVSSIPTFFALYLIYKLPDSLKVNNGNKKSHSSLSDTLKQIKDLPRTYWKTVLLAGFLSLSTYSSIFVAYDLRKLIDYDGIVAVAMIIFNFGVFLTAYPVGALADRYGRKKILNFSVLTIILTNILLNYAQIQQSYILAVLGILLWSFQLGTVQNQWLATISELSTEKNRGSAIGIYYFISALTLFVANTLRGSLETYFNPSAPYLFSISIAIIFLCFNFRKTEI